jgi:hypothetical protein
MLIGLDWQCKRSANLPAQKLDPGNLDSVVEKILVEMAS